MSVCVRVCRREQQSESEHVCECVKKRRGEVAGHTTDTYVADVVPHIGRIRVVCQLQCALEAAQAHVIPANRIVQLYIHPLIYYALRSGALKF